MQYINIPKWIQENMDLMDWIKSYRSGYLTAKKSGNEKKFLNNNKYDDIWQEFHQYVIPINDKEESSSDKEESSSDEEEKPKRGRPKKGNIMKARSDIRIKDGKRTLDTEMNIKKGLSTKEKKALKSSIDTEFDKKIKGGGIRNSRPVKIDLDSSDSDY